MQCVVLATKLVTAIVLVTIAFFTGKQALKWLRMYYYLRHLPHVEERWPFSLLLDTWTALRRMDRRLPITAKLFDYMQDLTSKIYEQEVTVAYYGPQPFVIGISPTVFEAILSSTVNLNKSFIYRMMKPWMGNGVLTSDKELWRTRRKILTPAFHFKILLDYVPIMNRRTNDVVGKLMQKGGTPVDILPILRKAAFGMLFETAMGVNINEEEVASKKLLSKTDELAASIISRVLNVFLWPNAVFNMTKEGRTFLDKVQYIRGYNQKIIQQRKAEYVSGGAGGASTQSFLDILLQMHIEEGTLTEDEVAEEVATFFIGGFDTTATAASYTLYLLGHHRDVQKKVHAEIDAIFGNDRQRAVTVEDIKELKYLDCVIKESLRLYPPVPLVARNIDEDVHIGQRFAQLEEKIMLTQVLRNFYVESVVPAEKLKLQLEIVLRPLQGIQLRLTPR